MLEVYEGLFEDLRDLGRFPKGSWRISGDLLEEFGGNFIFGFLSSLGALFAEILRRFCGDPDLCLKSMHKFCGQLRVISKKTQKMQKVIPNVRRVKFPTHAGAEVFAPHERSPRVPQGGPLS